MSSFDVQVEGFFGSKGWRGQVGMSRETCMILDVNLPNAKMRMST